MNEAEAKFIWIMLNEAGGRRSQPYLHYAEHENFGGCAADSTVKNCLDPAGASLNGGEGEDLEGWSADANVGDT